MENATITRNGKGWNLTFENGTSMPISWNNLPESITGNIQVKREKGQPVEIIYGGTSYFRPAPVGRNQSQSHHNENHNPIHSGSQRHGRYQQRSSHNSERTNEGDQNQKRQAGRAPYNFVPLNKQIISNNSKSDHSSFNDLSGFLETKIEAMSPLFIRGNDDNFFRVNETPYIPGSSIRGLVQSLVEIVSYGKLDNYEKNRRLYKQSNLKNDGNQVFGGFLRKKDGKYFINPAKYKQENRSTIEEAHKYHYNGESCTFSTGKFGRNLTVWNFIKNGNEEIILNLENVLSSYKSDDTRNEKAVDLLNSIKKGQIVDKKDDIIDRQTEIPPNLGIPVFYRLDNSKNIISIGHAKYHRIPYSRSIGDHISQNGDTPDFASSIFGTDKISGKVFFEDFALIGSPSYDLQDAKYPKILSSPKPTTYQHYLEQPNGIRTNYKDLKNWSAKDTTIRGWKLYWHKKTSSKENNSNTWIDNGNPTNSHPKPINPISVGSIFHGRIRFENLTKEELGALLFAIDLPDGCAHKLGMGKPLGLGSVKITTALTIISRPQRYTKVFDENGNWNTGEDFVSEFSPYKDKFAKYIGEETKQAGVTNAVEYWANDPRMQELKHLLTFSNNLESPSWEDRTRYMDIEFQPGSNSPYYQNGDKTGRENKLNEFKRRPVLPKPSEVVNPEIYKNL